MSYFAKIKTLEDVLPYIQGKKEIGVAHVAGGSLVRYQYQDKTTFDSPVALECRGILFDAQGLIVSRPLHKFFNAGENEGVSLDKLQTRHISAVFDKLDGSMIATAWIDGQLVMRSKASVQSSVARKSEALLKTKEFENIKNLCEKWASQGVTLIFELTDPEERIVVKYDRPQLRLLHARDNVSGEYLMLNPQHPIHHDILELDIPVCPRHQGKTLNDIIDELKNMKDAEGYVVQFDNGEMVKLKCPWYLRLHRAITFLRERDIARASLEEGLDDIKAALQEAGIGLEEVEEIEHRLKLELDALIDAVNQPLQEDGHLTAKEFAIKYRQHPHFGLLMNAYNKKENNYPEYYHRHFLKSRFSLRVLASGTLAEEFDMKQSTSQSEPSDQQKQNSVLIRFKK